MSDRKHVVAEQIWSVAIMLAVHAKSADLHECAALLSRVVEKAARVIAEAEKKH